MIDWEYWIALYTRTHCVARGLRCSTIAAYQATLEQFRAYVRWRLKDVGPTEIHARDVLAYLEHLRRDRDNGASALNRQVTVLRNFYRAMVAMGELEPAANPLVKFPKIKASPRKLPVVLSTDQVRQLLSMPGTDTVLGVRDRAILTLLYGTGIRASECATLLEEDVDLADRTIRVTGKGGHQRTLPLNDQVVHLMQAYRRVRGHVMPNCCFFLSRSRRAMSRGAIYERVRYWSQKAKLSKRVSPHRLRHTFATHLVQAGVGLVTIRDLLGHRLITSTQIYLHVTAQDLREAAEIHPIGQLAESIEHLLPKGRLPIQAPPGLRRCRDG